MTTNVSNFIMGSPIIDHYGDLVVSKCSITRPGFALISPANHRTGETCTLTFKPRGWRGANAFEIKGTVADASGSAAWDIAGREWLAHRSKMHLISQAGIHSSLPAEQGQAHLWRSTLKSATRTRSTYFFGEIAKSRKSHST